MSTLSRVSLTGLDFGGPVRLDRNGQCPNRVVLPSPFLESPLVDSLVRSAKTTLNPGVNSTSLNEGMLLRTDEITVWTY